MTAPILNDRDLALQAAKYRSKQTNLAITGTASAFLASKNSITISPTNIVLTASPSGSVFSGSATYTWSYALSSAPNTWIALGTGKTWTLNNSDTWIKNAFIQYRCIISENLLDDAYGYYTVTYSSEGAESNFINLSRTNVLVTCNSAGTPINYNNTDITVTVSRGTTSLTYSTNTTTPNSFTVSVGSANLTPITPSTSTSTSFTMPGITAIALDGATVTLTITVYDSSTAPVGTTYTKTIVYNKVSNGVIGSSARAVDLTVGTQAFAYTSAGTTPSPANTVLTATAQNTTGTVYYEFFVAGVSKQNLTTNTYTYTPLAAYASMPEQITVKIREGSDSSAILASDITSIIGIKPGVSAITGVLTNEATTVLSDFSGNVDSFTNTGGTFYVYDGITDKTTSGSVTYSVLSSTGLTISIASTGVYTITAMSSDSGVATLRAVYSSFTIDKVYSIVKSKAGPDGASLNPVANYDFAGATLPGSVTFPGTVATYENDTATLITNTVADQNLRLTNLSLVPRNSYIISMRVKWISGAWEGILFYANPAHGESSSHYKAIPQPALGVWTTINVDMRTLTAGDTDYILGGNISQLRFDFVNAVGASVAVDYISVGKYGVAEATKSITLSMYQWATSAPAYTDPFTYTWSTGNISAFPSGWSSAAGTAPGNGYTLYQRNITLTATITTATTESNWNLSTVNTIGYRNDGTIGAQGDSARTAYVVTREVWTNAVAPTSNGILAPTIAVTISATLSSSTINTVSYTNVAIISAPLPIIVGTKITLNGGTNFGVLTNTGVYYVKTVISATQVILSDSANLINPVALTYAGGSLTGITNSWSLTATSTLTDGQYMYQSDGILNNSTNIITWGMPYLSNLKVGSLSALSANLGVVEVATSGNLYSGKTTFGSTSAGFFLGNDGGNAKFKIGTEVVDGVSNELGFDSSTGVLTLRGGRVLNAAGNALLSASTIPADILNSTAISTAASDATTKANNAITTAASDATTKANNAVTTAASDATTKAAAVITGSNLCVNSDFNSTSNWLYGYYLIGANVGLNLGSGSASGWTLNMGNGEGTGTIYLEQLTANSSGYQELLSDPIVVVPGSSYFSSGYSGAHRCNVDFFVYYYTLDGTYNGNSNGTRNAAAYSGGITLSGYYRHKEKITPPANTAYIRVTLRKYATISENTNSYAFFTRVMFEETWAAAAEPGYWRAPGVGKVTVGSISDAAAAASAAALTAAQALTSAAGRLSRTSAEILSGSIGLESERAIYIGTTTTGLYLGSNGMTAINAGVPKFAIDANGNATFAGALSGATGEFAGTLRAGVLDLSTFAGVSFTYSSSNVAVSTTYQNTVPAGKNKMRVTIVGGGGGGGGGASRIYAWYTSQGGGGGGYSQAEFTVTPGATVEFNIGAGGSAGYASDPGGFGSSPGSDGGTGGATQIWYNGTLILSASGGGGGGRCYENTTSYPGGYGAAGTGTLNGASYTSATAGTRQNTRNAYQVDSNGAEKDGITEYYNYLGGTGGNSRYGSGGVGGVGDTGQAGGTGGGQGGGGGGGGSNTNNNSNGYSGGAGSAGLVIIEYFDANSVVLQSDYQTLKAALVRQNIAII